MGGPKPMAGIAGAAPRRRRLPAPAARDEPGRIRPAAGPSALADLLEREIVLEPGGSTGWHFHHVPLHAVVRSGTLTRFLYDGTVEVHEAGTRFVERGGAEHVHLGRNLGAEPVILHVTYALPEGLPLSVDAPAPRRARDGRPGPAAEPPSAAAPAHTRRRISPRTR
ncbi:cupin domain-containing protein [Streptomyces sp. NPDC006529]|uniref:cupin domain-containing protein n=1 Tax=Streptomyces sp. NPDC006529 TaxID=3157177 RepID=UPI0033B7751C